MDLRQDDDRFLWATRGRTWGFRFLRDGGLADPLAVYEEVFAEVGDQREAWCRVGDKAALRFPDPDGRRDRAGRIIPHDVVLLGPAAAAVGSIDDGRRRIWPQVADEFARLWDEPDPSS